MITGAVRKYQADEFIYLHSAVCMQMTVSHNTKSFMTERHRRYGLWWCYVCGLTLNEGYFDIRKQREGCHIPEYSLLIVHQFIM